jgi:hypothetical protein
MENTTTTKSLENITQCSTCIHSRGGSCWPEYPNATKCQDYKEDTEVKG